MMDEFRFEMWAKICNILDKLRRNPKIGNECENVDEDLKCWSSDAWRGRNIVEGYRTYY